MNKRALIILAATTLLIAILVIVAGVVTLRKNRSQMATTSPPLSSAESTSTPNLSPSPSLLPSPASTTTPLSPYRYPITRYTERVTVREYGRKVSTNDRASQQCGDPFSGYHTGDDLEAFSEELNQDVPIYAIADGTIKQVQSVNGYGGLIVIEHTLENQMYMAYYGHVSLQKANGKVGDTVTAGQQISVLGDHCSGETSNERKHMHFSIRRGTSNDVRGYVPTQTLLEEWVNPQTFLNSLNALSPE